MLYREIIAVCSQIHMKHMITLHEQNIQLLIVKLEVYIVTTGMYIVKAHTAFNCCSTGHTISNSTLYCTYIIYIYIYYIYIYTCSLCCVVLCRQTHCNVTTAASRLLLNANIQFIVSSELHCEQAAAILLQAQ